MTTPMTGIFGVVGELLNEAEAARAAGDAALAAGDWGVFTIERERERELLKDAENTLDAIKQGWEGHVVKLPNNTAIVSDLARLVLLANDDQRWQLPPSAVTNALHGRQTWLVRDLKGWWRR